MNITAYPQTLILIIANVIISIIGFSNNDLINKTILWPYGMKRENQWYRFISSGFIHADFTHLLFNMFTFYFFGSAIEYYFTSYGLGGNIAYLALYFIGMIVADLPSYIKEQDNPHYKALGASGAVSAVVFGCILFQHWGIITVYIIPMPFIIYAIVYLVYCVYMSKRNMGNVNHDAHLWGSLFGLGFTILLIILVNPELLQPILQELTHPHFV
ncbi:MAG: rhomboid family intramembrane serine protease [Sphingobacteriales bacterium]|nr:rhomboid family intramembrane serine protease [Sphingobacteriales bacterium]